MSKRQRTTFDLLALAFLAAGVLATLAIVSASADRRPDGANLLGVAGAMFAHELFARLGVAAYLVLCCCFVLVVALFMEGRRGRWCWRLVGWVVLIPAAALTAYLLPASWLPQTPAGAGGRLGTNLHRLLAAEFHPAGVWLIALGGWLAGLCLAADFAGGTLVRLLRIIASTCGFTWSGLAHRADAIRRTVPSIAKSDVPTLADVPIKHPDVAKLSHRLGRKSRSSQDAHAPAPTRRPLAIHYPPPVPREIPDNDYQLPPFDVLEDPEPFPYDAHDQQLRERGVKLEQTFTDFGLNVHVVGINTGPVITQYEVALETGLRLHKVTRLADDVALNLKVPSVRMVAPIPGKDTVGVEIPNEHRAVVRLKEVILNAGPRLEKCKIPLFLGKDTEGRPLIYDLAEMPHLLIAGRTGTGKSVCMNAIILSMLMTRRPDEVKMIMIDPKMLELSEYGRIPHLMHPVVKDMKKAEAILAWAVDKMEERYDLLSRARVRNIAGYNELSPDEIYRRVNPVDDDERARVPERMPYIVIFVDEMNDLMMTMRKEVEGHIIRLAQKSRAAGIHLVVATQKPTVDVITGLIKSNLPARICFQVASRTDSRVVLDEMGADKLLGRGDMLFLQPGTSQLLRAQGTYASDAEITRVVEYLECEPAYARELIQLSTSTKDGKDASGGEGLRGRDELYEAAIEVVVREGRGSVSLLQRALGIGYGRAARLIDFMAEDAIVGSYNGSNAREVLVTPEQWHQMKEASLEGAA
jgi:S-DNA-T family DNA segregation ATPase FtsK/SpoIIIE